MSRDRYIKTLKTRRNKNNDCSQQRRTQDRTAGCSVDSSTTALFRRLCKSAYITPLLKNAVLDSSDPKSHRSISNLSVLPKLLERLVSKQRVAYLLENDLFPDLQSAYRCNHSTKTAVLKALSDNLLALDSGKLALLSLLHLSAAFDSADTLLQRLQTSYGLGGNVIAWFASYLTGRTQYVRTAASRTITLAVLFGVPQGSVL